jgi:hypothetical protein
MTRIKSRSKSSAARKAAAPIKESAADIYMRESLTNPRFRIVTGSGQTFGIVGARPMSAVKK